MKSASSEVQPEIVHRLESLLALADQIEARLSAAQRQVDALTPSLPPPQCSGATSLVRAFRGDFVPAALHCFP